MGWSDKFVTLPSGKRVRYSFIRRDNSEFYYVRFIDRDGHTREEEFEGLDAGEHGMEAYPGFVQATQEMRTEVI